MNTEEQLRQLEANPPKPPPDEYPFREPEREPGERQEHYQARVDRARRQHHAMVPEWRETAQQRWRRQEDQRQSEIRKLRQRLAHEREAEQWLAENESLIADLVARARSEALTAEHVALLQVHADTLRKIAETEGVAAVHHEILFRILDDEPADTSNPAAIAELAISGDLLNAQARRREWQDKRDSAQLAIDALAQQRAKLDSDLSTLEHKSRQLRLRAAAAFTAAAEHKSTVVMELLRDVAIVLRALWLATDQRAFYTDLGEGRTLSIIEGVAQVRFPLPPGSPVLDDAISAVIAGPDEPTAH